MSNAEGLLRSRFDRSPGTAVLALGDLLVLAGFLTAGSMNHGATPLNAPGAVAETITPFLVGWVLSAVAVGAYAPGATRTVRTAVLRAASAWVVAAVIGLALRATPYFDGGAPLTFALVILGVGVVSFSLWRGVVAALR